MPTELLRDDFVAQVDNAVAELLAVAQVTGPPVDAIAIAQRHLGMVVCLDKRQTQRGRAQRSAGSRQIYLRPEPTVERHQWTVAHEIGEHFKPTLLNRLGVEPAEAKAMMGESLANLFAHRLLVPTCWYADDAPALGYDLLALKLRYSTSSHEVLAWRLLDLPEPCIITIIDNERIHRRRSNAWPTRRELAPAEKKCQRYVHLHGKPSRQSENGWTVHGWPVHTSEWKREILRSVVDMDL